MALKGMTKNLIADKVYELLTKKPITDLSISEITEACGISKRTLYNHFRDKFEIAQYICQRIDDAYYLEKSVTMTDLCEGRQKKDYSYFWDHQDFFRNVLCYQGQNSIADYLSELVLKRSLRDIRQKLGAEEIPVDLLASAEFFAYSVVAASYAMLKGAIPKRFQDSNMNSSELYLPYPLVKLFLDKE